MEPLEPPPTDPDTSARDGLVDALLGEAAFSGWTRAALATAASGLGLPEGEADRLFPGGPGQVLAFASRRADLRTVRDMEAAGVGRLKIRERIRLGVRTRLETHGGAPEAVRRALAFLALPTQAGLGLKLLYDTVDAIWYAAGDTSADFNFYTKRAILGGVLSATTLHWVNDRSAGHEKTWAFLDRRIEDVMTIEKVKARVRGWMSPGTARAGS
ncbi:MAG: COQ9 family protein [Alphaproteobacteria bacterium]|nr:COQ9 family protein [Alphaproteobacteria bacterium]